MKKGNTLNSAARAYFTEAVISSGVHLSLSAADAGRVPASFADYAIQIEEDKERLLWSMSWQGGCYIIGC